MEYQSKMTAGKIGIIPAPKASPVESVLNCQQSALVELQIAINNLEDRLRTILTPPQPQGGEKGDQVAHIQLTHIIEQHNLSIEMACKRIHEIIERLEL